MFKWFKFHAPTSPDLSFQDLTDRFLDALKQICKEYFDRMYQCESQKYDMEFEVRKRGFEVTKKTPKNRDFVLGLKALPPFLVCDILIIRSSKCV